MNITNAPNWKPVNLSYRNTRPSEEQWAADGRTWSSTQDLVASQVPEGTPATYSYQLQQQWLENPRDLLMAPLGGTILGTFMGMMANFPIAFLMARSPQADLISLGVVGGGALVGGLLGLAGGVARNIPLTQHGQIEGTLHTRGSQMEFHTKDEAMQAILDDHSPIAAEDARIVSDASQRLHRSVPLQEYAGAPASKQGSDVVQWWTGCFGP